MKKEELENLEKKLENEIDKLYEWWAEIEEFERDIKYYYEKNFPNVYMNYRLNIEYGRNSIYDVFEKRLKECSYELTKLKRQIPFG